MPSPFGGIHIALSNSILVQKTAVYKVQRQLTPQLLSNHPEQENHQSKSQEPYQLQITFLPQEKEQLAIYLLRGLLPNYQH